MTDDYKEQLLNYVTGKINPTQSEEKPVFINQPTAENDYYNLVRNVLDGFSILGTLQFSNNNNIIVYGNYNDNGTDRGAILIFSQSFYLIQMITTYDTGTKFNKFEFLKVDEDNLVYGVDNQKTSNANRYRFIMLNNISSKNNEGNYEVKLRKSYYFPSSYNTVTFGLYSEENVEERLQKKPNESSYLFVGRKNTNLFIIKLDINVGSENEWNSYTETQNSFGALVSCYLNWTNENLTLKIGGRDTTNGNNYYTEMLFNGSTITRTLKINSNHVISVAILNSQDTYIATTNYNEDNVVGSIYKVDYTNNTLLNIYNEEKYAYYLNPSILFKIVNGILFIATLWYNETLQLDGYVGLLANEQVYLTSIGTTSSSYIENSFFVINNFNLYNLIFLKRNTATIKAIDYNLSNYNGESYIDYNSILPKKVQIYNNRPNIVSTDFNNIYELIFARNLYNKTQSDNRTISTVEIPNTMLNNINLNKNKLIGVTNLDLVVDNNTITKNIYETLYLNYINIINVLDEDTNTPYINSAIKVNNSINIGTQTSYENSACTKYRINYTDTTTQINNLEWLPINKYNKTTQITFYADKNITSVDLISEDETTVYLSIPVEVEIGKTYTIKQKVRTGDKLTPVQLQYNNENVNYNNEPVMVYVEEE